MSFPELLDSSGGGHSANVDMHMVIEGRQVSVGQLGPDFLILDIAFDHAPTLARLYLAVDGDAREWVVWLPEGISSKSRKVSISVAPYFYRISLDPDIALRTSHCLASEIDRLSMRQACVRF